jgi:hypothetical protein
MAGGADVVVVGAADVVGAGLAAGDVAAGADVDGTGAEQELKMGTVISARMRTIMGSNTSSLSLFMKTSSALP